MLRAVRKRQAAEKLALGPAYLDRGYIFCREDGVPYSPDYITRAFREAVNATELPRIRLHDLRHTWATLALRAGVNPKVVSERLGHHSAAFTHDRYQHVTRGLDQDAAERVARLIRGD
jgi:integrase